MNKFAKRLTKLTHGCNTSCLVIGNGFGYIEDVSAVFKTVFIFNKLESKIKGRNIIYREDLDRITDVNEVNAILIDLDHIDYLKSCIPLWIRSNCLILIEKNECLERPAALPLWDNGYRAVEQHGFYHVWKRL